MRSVIFGLLYGLLNIIAPFQEQINDNKTNECILDEQVITPSKGWIIIQQKVIVQDDISFLLTKLHNPKNNDKNSLDAEFIMTTSNQGNMGKYNLLMGIYYHPDTIVVLQRIFASHSIKINKKIQTIVEPTRCFDRKVVPIIHNNNTDGGVK